MRSLGVLPPSLPAGNAAVRGLLRSWTLRDGESQSACIGSSGFLLPSLRALRNRPQSLHVLSWGVGGVCGFGFLLLSEAHQMQVVSKEYLDAHRTERGSWTMAQMFVLGVKWPQPPGWRDAIYGKELTAEQATRFEAAKALLTKSTQRKHAKQEVATFLAAGLEPPEELLEKLKPTNTPPTNPASIRRAAKKAAKKARKQQIRQIRELGQAYSATLPPLKKEPKPKPPKRVRQARAYVQPPPPNFQVPKIDPNSPEFLASFEWRTLRMKVLSHYGRVCMCCGASPENSGEVMHVDHIKPRRVRPDLALDFNNLQVLCGTCNHGKSNWNHDDFRPVEKPQDDFDANARAHLRLISQS